MSKNLEQVYDHIKHQLDLLLRGQCRILEELKAMAMTQADLDAKLAQLTTAAQAESDFETATANAILGLVQMVRDAKNAAGPDTTNQVAAIDAALATIAKGHGDLATAAATTP